MPIFPYVRRALNARRRYLATLALCVALGGCNRLEAMGGECRFEQRAVLPLTFMGTLPIITADIDGHAARLGIDTGSETSVLTPETVARLHLDTDNFHQVNAIGVNDITNVQTVFIYHLGIGGIDQGRVKVLAIGFGVPAGPDPEQSLAGLLGGDILSRYELDLDTPARKLTLYTAHGCLDLTKLPWPGPYATVAGSLTNNGRRMTLPVRLDGRNLTAVLDTGASRSAISVRAAPQLGLTDEVLAQDPSTMMTGLGGKAHPTPVHKFASMTIAGKVFPDTAMTVMSLPYNDADGQLLLGQDYIGTRRIWLSYATGMMAVQEPNDAAPWAAPP